MEQQTLEFFKLDNIDRKVLFWLMDNSPKSLESWTKDIARQYVEKKATFINAEALFMEVQIELDNIGSPYPDERTQ